MTQKLKDELKDLMQQQFDHSVAPPWVPDINPDLLGDEVRESFITIPFIDFYLEPYKDEADSVAAMKEHFEGEGYTVVVHPDRLVISKKWDKDDIPKAKAREKARKEKHDKLIKAQEKAHRKAVGLDG